MEVNVNWTWIKWNIGNKWRRDILPQLNYYQIPEYQLERCVYVVRANGDFTIKYPLGSSPTLYIGQGNFKSRLEQHKNWLKPLCELTKDFPFLIGLSFPRVRNNEKVYCDLEAFLIQEFKSIYGLAPLKNKKMQKRLNPNYIYIPKNDVRGAIMTGSGNRYSWALEPLPSNEFYYDYYKA
ncbi:hypothetical protein ACFLUQ_02115 [Chloroflexota bacterium]